MSRPCFVKVNEFLVNLDKVTHVERDQNNLHFYFENDSRIIVHDVPKSALKKVMRSRR